MSHFPVAVLTKPGGKSLEELMAEFNINTEVPPYVLYTKEQFITKSRSELMAQLRYYKDKYNREQAKPKITYGDTAYVKCLEDQIIELENCLELSDEEFYQDRIKTVLNSKIGANGEILSTRNPNGKWDYYMIGGQYDGMLSLKNGLLANTAYVTDVDFTTLDNEKYARSILWWEINIDGRKPKPNEEQLLGPVYPSKEFFVDRFKTKENYARIKATFSTYAVVTPDGIWYEMFKNEILSTSKSEEDVYQWIENYYMLFIKPAESNWIITIVDCYV